MDETAGGLADFLQNIAWTGLGGASDTFDYSGSARPPDNAPIDPDQVDALANNNDFLFDPVRMSLVPFVVSFGGIGDIYFHDRRRHGHLGPRIRRHQCGVSAR